MTVKIYEERNKNWYTDLKKQILSQTQLVHAPIWQWTRMNDCNINIIILLLYSIIAVIIVVIRYIRWRYHTRRTYDAYKYIYVNYLRLRCVHVSMKLFTIRVWRYNRRGLWLCVCVFRRRQYMTLSRVGHAS